MNNEEKVEIMMQELDLAPVNDLVGHYAEVFSGADDLLEGPEAYVWGRSRLYTAKAEISAIRDSTSRLRRNRLRFMDEQLALIDGHLAALHYAFSTRFETYVQKNDVVAYADREAVRLGLVTAIDEKMVVLVHGFRDVPDGWRPRTDILCPMIDYTPEVTGMFIPATVYNGTTFECAGFARDCGSCVEVYFSPGDKSEKKFSKDELLHTYVLKYLRAHSNEKMK